MRKINVLHASRGLGLGGIEKVLQAHTEHLSKEIFHVSVCGLFEGGERGEFLRDRGFEVYVLNGDIEKMIDLMQIKKIDVLHVHQHGDLNRLALKAARAANVPVVVETNEFGKIKDEESNDSPDMNFMVSKMCALRYKLWKGCSWKEFLENSDVLYNCITLSDFITMDGNVKRLLREKYQIPDGFYVIGRHGQPHLDKWGDMCLEMMPYLLERVPNVKYIALGLPQSKILKIKDMGLESSFIFLEPTKDFQKINEILCLLDVFTYSSVNGECLSLAIAEAMACKLPVVVNSTPCRDNGQVEMVEHTKTGFIANNAKAYAEAVAFLLQNEKERLDMGAAALSKVEQVYEIKPNIVRLEKHYLDLLTSKGIEIDPAIMKRYENINTKPYPEEIIDFEQEYKKILRTCWGKPNYFQIYFWELILKDYGKYKIFSFMKSLPKKIKCNFSMNKFRKFSAQCE
jgi:glycosyltransferase involved in cell wall biosynthesis